MIDPKFYGIIELALFGALAVGFGVWQLAGLKKLERDRKREQDQQHKDSEK